MTVDELKSLELPIDATAESCLYICSALDWLQANTTLEFDKSNIESIQALPDGAKLFLCKFAEITSDNGDVTSESLGGMSQSFSDKDRSSLLWRQAKVLIGGYLKSRFKSVPHVSGWT